MSFARLEIISSKMCPTLHIILPTMVRLSVQYLTKLSEIIKIKNLFDDIPLKINTR
jgi:hypothetical protein